MIVILILLLVLSSLGGFVAYMVFSPSSGSPGSSGSPVAQVPPSSFTPCTSDSQCINEECVIMGAGAPGGFCMSKPQCWSSPGTCKQGDFCHMGGTDCGMNGVHPMSCQNIGGMPGALYGECDN